VIRLTLLGQIGLISPDGTPLRRILAGDRRLGLLAYLALAMPGERRREAILGMFWPDASPEEARHRLRQLLYILRTEVGEDVLTAVGREEMGLNPTHFWCDAVAFEQAHSQGNLEGCLKLYGGSFCEGLFIADSPGFDRWIEDIRYRLHDKAVSAAWQLAHNAERGGNLAEACRWGSQALLWDPNEERLRWLLGLYEQSGDRARALRVFDRFERTLADEYDMGPSPETLQVVERIRSISFKTPSMQ
jgi:DNA-binding SARP family transcriptional activator